MNLANTFPSPIRNGPPLCNRMRLPAHESRQAALDYHNKNAPGTHITDPWECTHCGGWHYESRARGPSGQSSGTERK
jgi:hypothetical protein